MDGAARRAARLQQLAMHVNNAFMPGPFMQVVDILRHQRHRLAIALRQTSQRFMRRIRLRALQISASLIVKSVDQRGIFRKGLRSRNIFNVVLRPDAFRIAKGRKPRIRRYAGAGRSYA